MKRRVTLALAALLGAATVAAPATPAGAITFGSPDGGRHPNVGSLVGTVDGGTYQWCTGTLIDANTFLTASHCVDDAEGVTFHVTFTEVIDANADGLVDKGVTLLAGTPVMHPLYASGGQNDPYDIAVFELAKPVRGITPAPLPKPGYFDTKAAARATYTAVGYGTERNVKTGGLNTFELGTQRKYAVQTVNSIVPSWVTFSMNPANGNAGTCYGDSGGPHFLGGPDQAGKTVVSITVTGDIPCRSTDKTYRLDTPAARAFLAPYVALPS